jgi:hypothetical protein
MDIEKIKAIIQQREALYKEHGAEIDCDVLMKLGAKKEHGTCSVWEKQYGYQYFFVYLKLAKRISIEWSPSDRVAVLTRTNKEHSIVSQVIMQSETQLRDVVGFFQDTKPTIRLFDKTAYAKEEGDYDNDGTCYA